MRNDDSVEGWSGVSPEWAFSMMAEKADAEIELYVEDAISESLVLESLPPDVRRRIHITSIGSWVNVIQQIIAHYRNPDLGKYLAIIDGDIQLNSILDQIKKLLPNDNGDAVQNEVLRHCCMLPGSGSPETWFRQLILEDNNFTNSLATTFNLDDAFTSSLVQVTSACESKSLIAEISHLLNLKPESVLHKLVYQTVFNQRPAFETLVGKVAELLAE